MEWGVVGDGFVRVMTDEQMDVLRKQIAVYGHICEQLVEMHKSLAQQQDSIAGLRFGGAQCDALMAAGGHRIAARQRWTPTPMQLQILEGMFKQGNGTPSKQKIKEIALELSLHGQISETNVYNWFQNRRARSKRKQAAAPSAGNPDSEADADDESSVAADKKPRAQQPLYTAAANSSSSSQEAQLNSSNAGQLAFYDDILSSQRMDQLFGREEGGGGGGGGLYGGFRHGDSFFNMFG